MTEQPTTSPDAPAPTIAALAYNALACLAAALCVGTLLELWRSGIPAVPQGYAHINWIGILLPGLLLIACICSLTGGKWALHLTRVTAIWVAALLWPDIPPLVGAAFEHWSRHNAVDTSGIFTFSWWGPTAAAAILRVLILLALVSLSNWLYNRRITTPASPDTAEPAPQGQHILLLITAVVAFALGLGLLLQGRLVIQRLTVEVIGAYLMAAAFILFLLWHLSLHRFFWVGAIVSTAAIITACHGRNLVINLTPRDFSRELRAAVTWAPVVLIAIAALTSRRTTIQLRLAAPLAAALLVPMTLSLPYLHIDPLHFRPPLQAARQTTIDPDYIFAPPGAYQVRHSPGGLSLFFMIKQPYPASGVIESVDSSLRQAGFHKLDYDLFDPNTESSHLRQWHHPLADTDETADTPQPTSGNRIWNAHWVNDNDDVVGLTLVDISQADAEIMTIRGVMNCQPSPTASQLLTNYRRLHAD